MRKISLAIPVHNILQRKFFIIDNLNVINNDNRVSEVIISVEPDSHKIPPQIEAFKKVKIVKNKTRQYVFRNKYIAISACANDWVVCLDSDNVIDQNYINAIYKIDDWNSDTVYQPDFLMPRFDLRRFSNKLFECKNVARFMSQPLFRTMLNAMNYLLNKNTFIRNNSEAFGSGYDPKCADSIFINYNLLKNGGAIQVVRGMYYNHCVHDGSFYKQSAKQYGYMNKEIENQMRELK